MSALFRRPKAPTPVGTAPDPRDEEARIAADLARRSAGKRGKSATVLTRLTTARASGGATSTPKTTLGGG